MPRTHRVQNGVANNHTNDAHKTVQPLPLSLSLTHTMMYTQTVQLAALPRTHSV